jgi:outer membrane lipoprotein LolB
MVRGWRTSLACAALLALAACASIGRPGFAEISRSGRFALTAAWNEGEPPRRESSSGRFTLHAGGGRQVLDLSSPIGTTVARIQVDESGAVLTAPTAQGMREVRSANAEALTQDVLGFRLPVGGLSDWIQGRPAATPSPASVEGDPRSPDSFVQNDWRVRIAERSGGSPRRLLLEYPASGSPPAGTPAVRLTLLVDEQDS